MRQRKRKVKGLDVFRLRQRWDNLCWLCTYLS